MRAGLALLVALVPFAVGGACSVPDVRVLLPRKEVTYMPLTVEVDFVQAGLEQTLEVRLNGVDITGQMTIDPPANGRRLAWADDVWGAGLVLPGTNVVDASIELPNGTLATRSKVFEAVGDPFADAVPDWTVGTDGGFNEGMLPAVVTGPPEGGGLFEGGLDVFSLGLGGAIELEFVDNAIVDGPGADFTVFENAFLERNGLLTLPPFSEPGRVSVSQDGTTWFTFSACQLVSGAAPYHPGCAGVYPVLSSSQPSSPHPSIPTTTPIEDLVGQNVLFLVVPEGSGGDSFDLADVGLTWARYVAIDGAGFVSGPAAAPTAGFDLDAVAAIHSVPATDADGNGVPDAVE